MSKRVRQWLKHAMPNAPETQNDLSTPGSRNALTVVAGRAEGRGRGVAAAAAGDREAVPGGGSRERGRNAREKMRSTGRDRRAFQCVRLRQIASDCGGLRQTALPQSEQSGAL